MKTYRTLGQALLLAGGIAGGWTVHAMTSQDPIAPATAEVAEPANEVVSPLETLDWMVGEWSADTPQASVAFSVKYSKNNAFLIRSFKMEDKSQPDVSHSGMQIVAWDPSRSALRSWTFDANGGFGEDVWSQLGDKYTLRTTYTLPDGGRGASINYLSYLDPNTFVWKSTHREIDGELMPDTQEIVFQRVLEEAAPSNQP